MVAGTIRISATKTTANFRMHIPPNDSALHQAICTGVLPERFQTHVSFPLYGYGPVMSTAVMWVPMRTKVSIVGASGYGGGEFARLLTGHPGAQIVHLTRRSSKLTALDIYAQIMHIKAYEDYTEY